MTRPVSMHVVGSMLALLMVAASPANAPMSDVLTLSSPNEKRHGGFGNSVAAAGDVNRDGLADVIVGAPREEGTSLAEAGRAYVFSGADGVLLFELVSSHETRGGNFGYSVAGVGDIDHDGFDDLFVGADRERADFAGRAYVFSGRDGSVLIELISPNVERLGGFGGSVAGAGDVNQDGFPDLIVGALYEDPGSPYHAGRAYVFSGQDASLLYELVSPNEEMEGHFGTSVAGAGDVNQDGAADLLVGAPEEDGGDQDSGRAYVFSGVDGSVLSQLVSPNPWFLGGFGRAAAGAGDVNQDGLADVIVGATGEDDFSGRAYVFSGQTGDLIFELDVDVFAFGTGVAGTGDVDRDGFDDVIVGALYASPGNSPPRAGRAYVFGGRDGSLLFELVSPNEEIDGLFGYLVAGAGDVDQDGFADVLVGSEEDPGTSPNGAGRAYVFMSPFSFRINSGGPNYTDTNGSLFVADRAYAPGGFGYVGGLERTLQPIGGTDDDPLYQDVRIAREGDAGGIFAYRFDVAAAGRYDVTLYLMAPALDGAGNVVMDVRAEEDVIFDNLDVTSEAGGEYQALIKTFAVDVNDGTLDLRFRAVNKVAVVSAIAVSAQTDARASVRKMGSVR